MTRGVIPIKYIARHVEFKSAIKFFDIFESVLVLLGGTGVGAG